jgi:hypothetical protein
MGKLHISNYRPHRFIEAEGRQESVHPDDARAGGELQHYQAVIGEERMFPPKRGTKGERQRAASACYSRGCVLANAGLNTS